MEINFENFSKFNIQVGTIIKIEDNVKARKPAYVIDVDFGKIDGIKKSSAQVTKYTKDELLNKKVIAVTNFPKKNIAGVISEILILGAITGEDVKLLGVDSNVEDGTKIG
ncbi:MAG: tRNA-binding protein [SAR116 cluster bacterium]|nr:tRNA-binding protein [SAR116 cluster bacterium]RPH11160.1 MAG: tRNA-binding protein [Alphaproteobacteria bacterium TMED54]|tara:strand:- start:4024 stop:4353 length:330 start_codon:yes stop_codon:yes gene_type:complete